MITFAEELAIAKLTLDHAGRPKDSSVFTLNRDKKVGSVTNSIRFLYVNLTYLIKPLFLSVYVQPVPRDPLDILKIFLIN